MSVLILGSEGQIGLGLQKVLRDKNVDIICIDILLGKQHDLRLNNNEFVREQFSRASFVYFLAYDIGGSKYLSKTESNFNFINNNILIMQNVFSLLKEFKMNFIFASSQMSNMFFSNYGLLKSIGEKYTSSLSGLYCKFWNVFGFENDFNKSHVISDFIRMAVETGEIKMITDGKEQRDFLYAEDAGFALECIRENYDKFNSADSIDIASFEQYTILEVAKIVSDLISKQDKKIKVIQGEKVDSVQRGINNIPKTDILKFWNPKFKLKDGIAELLKQNA